jgi:NADPH:quinone reductase-like Zn-dependent oxidoreductase
MLAAVVERYGPPEVVHLAECATPQPGAGEIRVRVGATVVGASDSAFRSGTPWFARLFAGLRRPRRPILGSEFAGTVDAVGAVGAGVAPFAVGDRVYGATGAAAGAHAQFVVVAADGAVQPIPPGLADADAAAVVDGFLTALPFLRDVCRVQPGQRVLVHGASGTVGSAAVQLARWMGAHVTAVTSTPNVELVRSLGAERVVDYTRERFADARDANDVVFDAVGKSSFGAVRRALAEGGVYASTVPSLALLIAIPLTRLRRGRRAAIAFTGLRADASKRTDLELLGRLVAGGEFVPVIDRVVPFAEVVAAHARVDSGRKVGAVVVTV